MTEMFSGGANLSGLSEFGQPLQVSDVVHKAIIEIDEEGAVAAAATGSSEIFKLLFNCFQTKFFHLFQA